MSNFNLDNFKSEVLTRDLARSAKFEILLTPPRSLLNIVDMKLINIFCESSNIPGINIATRPFRIYGPAYQRPVSADYGGEGITMVFAVDANMLVRKFFDAWLNTIINPLTFNVN